MTVATQQRHTRAHRCPICGGADGDGRGKGERCFGFTSADGEWCHCMRPELGGALSANDMGAYVHRMRGPCKCGVTHNDDHRTNGHGDPEAIYPYVDEQGALLFEVVRMPGKRFLQRTKDAAGGWVWKLNGARRVLYRLDELVADDADRTVHIAEGEKDVDRLRQRGFLATCNPGGAGKWPAVADLARRTLAGRDVVVVADGDDVGRSHARDIEQSLRAVARSIRVLEPSAPHKDVSDLLDAGGSLDDLVMLGAKPAPTVNEPLRGLEHLSRVAVVGRAAIGELADRPIVWIWQYIATAGLVVLLAAGPGSGKTTLLFLLVIARANRGGPVKILGYEVTPAHGDRFIVIIENEHSDESASRILRKSCRLLGIDESALDRIILVARGNVRIGSPEWTDVETLIAAGLVSDVMLDTLARTSPRGADGNDEGEQVEVFELLASAIQKAPTPSSRPTFWTGAHTRKVDGMPTLGDVSGSAQRTGQADVVLLMGAERAGDKVASVKIAFGKVREKDAEDWPEPVSYVIRRDRVTVLDAPEQDDRPLEDRIAAMLESGSKTKSALADKLGRNRPDIEDAISALFAARRITKTTVKVRGREYPAFALRNDGVPDGVLNRTTDHGVPRRTASQEGLKHAD